MPDDGEVESVGRFGPIQWVDRTTSTNDDVALAAREGAAEGLVVVADHQTKGRGRLGRSFEAPSGSSLLTSILLRPQFPTTFVALVPLALGVAVVDACRALVTTTVGLKWPNDVLIGPRERKVAGILTESVVTGGRVDAVVAGVGVNANWSGGFPSSLAARAVSLDELTGRPVDRRALLRSLLRSFDGWYGSLSSESGRSRLIDRYRSDSLTVGRDVRVDTPDGLVTGYARDVTGDGHLVVEAADGDRVVVSGDVS